MRVRGWRRVHAETTSVVSHSRSRLHRGLCCTGHGESAVDKAMHVRGRGVCMLKQLSVVFSLQAAPRLCAPLSCSESAVDKRTHVRGLRRVHAGVASV
jgi:hypothetical protein